MLRRGVFYPFLRFAYRLFYNPFAFTYDTVSSLVSRGQWRTWTRAAIPYLRGSRILEVPCGTGNLLLDLSGAGYAPVGVDLSPWMLRITRGKFGRGAIRSRLVRARVQALPFPDSAFDSVIMTFPPGFIYDPLALGELRRVLAVDGILLWVDAGRLVLRDAWSRFRNWALDTVDGGGETGDFASGVVPLLTAAGFRAQTEWVENKKSRVAVVKATKG